jgi:hypothetical protein
MRFATIAAIALCALCGSAGAQGPKISDSEIEALTRRAMDINDLMTKTTDAIVAGKYCRGMTLDASAAMSALQAVGITFKDIDIDIGGAHHAMFDMSVQMSNANYFKDPNAFCEANKWSKFLK